MKKSVLALSISAAVLGLGFAGGAHAVIAANPNAPGYFTTTGGNSNGLAFSDNGVGHILVVPYYTAEASAAAGANHTMINLVNTDTVNGKAVKVRFRGASNSDDVFDFQVFLSPGDVYAMDIALNAANGLARLSPTGDASCTKPDFRNAAFVAGTLPTSNWDFKTTRLDPYATAAARAAQTLEGYVEILNMADITPGGALGKVITHAAGVAECGSKAAAAWTLLDTDQTNAVLKGSTIGLAEPTTGLMANWTILNITNQAAWGANATAMVALNSAGLAQGNIVYWPQTDTQLLYAPTNPTMGNADVFTADPMLDGMIPWIQPLMMDLPDLSTPYLNVWDNPLARRENLTYALATTVIQNEFETLPGIFAQTDWVLAQPTRRYHITWNYYVGGDYAQYFHSDYYAANFNIGPNSDFTQLCSYNITYKAFNRDEVQPSTVFPSPQPRPALCGEVSVLTFNNPGAAFSGVLGAKLTVQDLDITDPNNKTINEGWMTVNTGGLYDPANPLSAGFGGTNMGSQPGYMGLPILGFAATRAVAGATYFGANWDHRTKHVNQFRIGGRY